MVQIEAIKFIKCEFCEYSTKRAYDLKRHHYGKHKGVISNNIYEDMKKHSIHPNGQNVHANGQNVHPNEQNVHPNGKNVKDGFICIKCNKIYKTKKNLLIHELRCNGVDDLTCSRCMISFSTRQGKSNHLKRNNCKPRSIKSVSYTHLTLPTTPYV